MGGSDARALSRSLLDLCRMRKLTIATAESCNGGLVAGALTDIPGSSDVIDRGFVTYSNDAKRAMLGVEAGTLANFGAVSKETATAMAIGALERAGTDLAVAITGIAGPGGATPGKPVGLVHFAAAARDGRIIHREQRARMIEHPLLDRIGIGWLHLRTHGQFHEGRGRVGGDHLRYVDRRGSPLVNERILTQLLQDLGSERIGRAGPDRKGHLDLACARIGAAVDDGRAPYLSVGQEDLRVVGRDQLGHEQRQGSHLARPAGDLDIIADVKRPKQQQHDAGGEIGERAL